MSARFIVLLALVCGSCGDRHIDDDVHSIPPPPDAGPADLGSSLIVDATCSTPIDWTTVVIWWSEDTPVAVKCCCTQEPM